MNKAAAVSKLKWLETLMDKLLTIFDDTLNNKSEIYSLKSYKYSQTWQCNFLKIIMLYLHGIRQ